MVAVREENMRDLATRFGANVGDDVHAVFYLRTAEPVWTYERTVREACIGNLAMRYLTRSPNPGCKIR
jgi:hypothetical protein